jgi:molecular chaperone HtpG
LIDLLSNHLYSGPEVFVRELLQNGVDAIRARQAIDRDLVGQIGIELTSPPGGVATLSFVDNGMGLTEAEVHRFLAVIGESSKRTESGEKLIDFIGQFGIGLLACFLVSDEIVVISRSATGAPAVEWRGRPDGTYQLKTLELDLDAGTQVFLKCKPGCEEYFDFEQVRRLASLYGGMLPFPVRLSRGNEWVAINSGELPWRAADDDTALRRRAWLRFGEELFGQAFLDAIPLSAKAGAVEGLAFVLPASRGQMAKRADRVYLKRMLVSESADNLLPDWAFFVKAVVNAEDLRPTASRESFYEDERLESAREALGECLRSYLVKLAQERPEKFRDFLGFHQLAIEALAVEDDECFRVFIDWLPFETAAGRMTLPEFRERHQAIHFVADIDQFRQVARVASAQGLGLINAGYVYAADLLRKYADANPDLPVHALEASEIAESLEDLTPIEEKASAVFLETAQEALSSYRCAVEMRKFLPRELTSLYSTSAEGRFLRTLEQTQEKASPLWSGVLQNLAKNQSTSLPAAQLCFNYENPLVRRLVKLGEGAALRRAVQMLYVQAILLGHHPLSSREWTLLNEGLAALVESSLGAENEGRA